MTGLSPGAVLPSEMNARQWAEWNRSQSVSAVSDASAAAAVAAHVAASDPHPTYTTAAELAAAIAAAIAALPVEKSQRVTTGSVATLSSALVTLTWSAAFADANYTVAVSVEDSTTSNAALSVIHVESKTAAAITVRVYNASAGSLTGTINAIARHD